MKPNNQNRQRIYDGGWYGGCSGKQLEAWEVNILWWTHILDKPLFRRNHNSQQDTRFQGVARLRKATNDSTKIRTTSGDEVCLGKFWWLRTFGLFKGLGSPACLTQMIQKSTHCISLRSQQTNHLAIQLLYLGKRFNKSGTACQGSGAKSLQRSLN